MDNILIANWNSVVGPEDIVYHLGDFTMGGLDRFIGIHDRLYGVLHVIPGGHDRRWIRQILQRKHLIYEQTIENVMCFIHSKIFYILPPVVTLKIEDKIIVLSHHAHRVWDRSHYGSYHFYGHSHGKLPPLGRSTDVGVDASSYYPCSLGYALMECDINAARIEEK